MLRGKPGNLAPDCCLSLEDYMSHIILMMNGVITAIQNQMNFKGTMEYTEDQCELL